MQFAQKGQIDEFWPLFLCNIDKSQTLVIIELDPSDSVNVFSYRAPGSHTPGATPIEEMIKNDDYYIIQIDRRAGAS